MRSMIIAGLVVHLLVIACPAGPTYTFTGLTRNDPTNVKTGISQLWFQVSQSDQASVFTFHNDGPLTCSVTELYIDDDAGILNSIAFLANGPGVRYRIGARPSDPPGAENAIPPFLTTPGLSAQSMPPTIRNGIGPGEWLTVGFDLTQGSDHPDLLHGLDTGTIRVALHVQGFGNGGSESFVNIPTIPGPASIGLVCMGLLMAGRLREQKKLRNPLD